MIYNRMQHDVWFVGQNDRTKNYSHTVYVRDSEERWNHSKLARFITNWEWCVCMPEMSASLSFRERERKEERQRQRARAREREYVSSRTFPWVGRAPRLLTSPDLASPFPCAPPLSTALSTLFWSGQKSFLVSNFLSPVAVGKITRSAPSIGRQVAKLKAHTAKQIK